MAWVQLVQVGLLNTPKQSEIQDTTEARMRELVSGATFYFHFEKLNCKAVKSA